MRTIAIGFMAIWIAGTIMVPQAQAQAAGQPAAAQAAPPQPVLFKSAADVAALIAKARAERKEGQANFGQNIVRLAPYNANLEYRASVGNASIHEHEAELFYVVDGSGTMVTGGKMAGTAIEGGVSRTIAKGDFILVPENTPHWFSAINQTLILMSLHVPRPVPAR